MAYYSVSRVIYVSLSRAEATEVINSLRKVIENSATYNAEGPARADKKLEDV